MNLSFKTLLAVLCVAALTPAAVSQHAGLVLFGDPNPAAAEVEPMRKAVHPVTSPYYHEDSFVTTDVRAWFLYHDFPKSSAIGGGNAKVYALQIRAALTESLQFVAYKDGYTDFDSGLVKDDGWNDLAAGVKWAFLQDFETDMHAAVGLGYQLGIGDDDVLQGDDELRLWASFNKGFEALHLGGTINLLLPTDNEEALGDSDRLTWHLHADYWLCEWFSAVAEVNGYVTLDDGDNAPLPFSAVDVANIGGGEGEDVVTLAPGFEVRPASNVGLRAAYEFPITSNEDLFGYRWTLSAVVSF
ncbi:hypothetical protein [Algisphaera agarilytica]|uniref:MetA-pathway of phenol degradation n=1 Tax=Algisphaera agarilytica TaxID=1385975 RepID=A0A7X0H2U6_9BACT|nr:hypothetical protein [Algisphaera agarilytica]MBB6428216.1 hypothetical protein [Algisphaera agarilytica]